MVDTVHVKRNMERNSDLGMRDFYLAVDANDCATFAGSMPLEEACRVIDNMIVTRDSLVIENWLPSQPPPSLPMTLEELFKKPALLRPTAVKFSRWLRQDLGLGEGRLLGWNFPIGRDLMLLTDRLMPGVTSSTFSLSSLITWLSMGKLSNGFTSGNTSLLQPGTGITSWMNFMKIFLEVEILAIQNLL